MSSVAWVEFFVEEPSMDEALRGLVPKIRPDLAFDIHAFSGKNDLLKKLPNRFAGFAGWIPKDWRLVVVLDEDRADCRVIKRKVEQIAQHHGLCAKKAGSKTPPFHVLTRLAVEELEAWFFGDVPALAATYARIPATLGNKKNFRNPDAISGGTWEALERVLQQAGHFLGGIAKIQVAREVVVNMDPSRNQSRSFQVFRDGLRAL